MERKFVNSSNLLSVGYDSDSQILEIQFRSGGIYQYLRVPQSVYDALMSAPSHGRYLHYRIKPFYAYRHIG
jgi:hypothetical protein